MKGNPQTKSQIEEDMADLVVESKELKTAVDGAYNKVLLLAYRGMSVKDISKELKLSSKYVRGIRYSAVFKKKLVSLGENIQNKILEVEANSTALSRARMAILEGSYRAALTVIEISLMGTADDKTKLMACIDILDRAGLKPREVVETVSRQYTPEEIQSMNKTLSEVENVTMRLTNKESHFVLSKSVKSLQGQVSENSSSDTDKAPDASNRISESLSD